MKFPSLEHCKISNITQGGRNSHIKQSVHIKSAVDILQGASTTISQIGSMLILVCAVGSTITIGSSNCHQEII